MWLARVVPHNYSFFKKKKWEQNRKNEKIALGARVPTPQKLKNFDRENFILQSISKDKIIRKGRKVEYTKAGEWWRASGGQEKEHSPARGEGTLKGCITTRINIYGSHHEHLAPINNYIQVYILGVNLFLLW